MACEHLKKFQTFSLKCGRCANLSEHIKICFLCFLNPVCLVDSSTLKCWISLWVCFLFFFLKKGKAEYFFDVCKALVPMIVTSENKLEKLSRLARAQVGHCSQARLAAPNQLISGPSANGCIDSFSCRNLKQGSLFTLASVLSMFPFQPDFQ